MDYPWAGILKERSLSPPFIHNPWRLTSRALLSIALFAAALPAAAYGELFTPKIPGCSNPKTLDLVKEIARQQQPILGKPKEIKHIRTTDQNSYFSVLVTRYRCAAALDYAIPGWSTLLPITYTVELTDDDNYYVTVYGMDQ